jgi:drug/metabolite transporter (DMT)-like permease
MSTAVAPLEERRILGIGLGLAAYCLFVGLDSSAKWLGLIGIPAFQLIAVRYGVHFALVLAVNLPTKGLSLVHSNNVKLEIIRAILLMCSTICNFLAFLYLPLTVTGAIGFTAPLLITAFSMFFLKEIVGWRRWTAIGIGFLGTLIVVRPGTEMFHPATFSALASTIFYACYTLITRKLAGVDSAGTQQFYGAALPTIIFVPLALTNWVWPSNPVDFLALALVGIFGFAGHQLMTVSLRFAPASAIAPFAYVQLLLFAVVSWLIFNQPPDIYLYLGAPLIIGSGLYIWMRERALGKATQVPTEAR